MFEYPVVYVDIETTGGSYRTSRVLEVAAIRVENGVTTEFSSLIDPETHIPHSITRITGINSGDIVGAPTFDQIADELFEILDGAVFIAHNVRFDYSFLKSEFARIGMNFSPRMLCTVRLSRRLYAQERGHSLAVIIDRHAIPVDARHRAMADTKAIKLFTELAYNTHGTELFQAAINHQLKSQSLPPHLDPKELDDVSNEAGVYIFRDEHSQPLYVGKSVTLKSRIMSHFRDTTAKELKISQNVHHVETIRTGSELGALVLESKLVKELQPLFNRQLRRISKYALLVKAMNEAYATLQITSGVISAETDLGQIYGLYPTRTKAKSRIIELVKTFELCPKLMGIEKTKSACFSYSLGRCKGACIGEESPELYNRRFELALDHNKLTMWPYDTAISVPINQEGEQVIIDNWIIRGYVSAEGERLYDDDEPTFDVDEYKIIRRFIRENRSFVRQYTS